MSIWTSRVLVVTAAALALAGCAHYQTPGAGVSLAKATRGDDDIADRMKVEPASPLPANIAMVRVQSPGYRSGTADCRSQGAYCVVSARDIESDQDAARLVALPMITNVAAMSPILLPPKVESIKDLRLAAATLKADMLLVYTVDTRFHLESTDVGPLSLITLGFFPSKKAEVTSTASAALFDVRTGFVYGSAESTAKEQQRATSWSTEAAFENARKKSETLAYKQMIGEFEKLWKGVVETRARSDGPRS